MLGFQDFKFIKIKQSFFSKERRYNEASMWVLLSSLFGRHFVFQAKDGLFATCDVVVVDFWRQNKKLMLLMIWWILVEVHLQGSNLGNDVFEGEGEPFIE